METMKTNTIFDQDFELLIPFSSLRISALSSAAKISKYVTNVTIGPNSTPIPDENVNNSNVSDTSSPRKDESSNRSQKTPNCEDKNVAVARNNNNSSSTKKKKCWFSEIPEIDIYDSDPPSPKPISIDDIKSVSQKYHQRMVEKEIASQSRKELAERAERIKVADELRQAKHMEATRAAEKCLHDRMIESERLILEAVADVERLEQEFEAEQQQKLNEMKRRELDLKEKSKALSQFRAIHALFKQAIERFMKAFIDMNKEMQEAFTDYKKGALTISKAFEGVAQKIAQGHVDQDAIKNAEKYQKEMDRLTNDMISNINEIKVAEQNAKEAQEEKLKQEQALAEQQVKEAEAAASLVTMASTPIETRDAVDNQLNQQQQQVQRPQHALSQFVSEQSLHRYQGIMSVYRISSEEVKKLSDDQRTKDYRMNCQKAVNTPINAISATSPDFLLDKYRKLEALLRGEIVTVGNAQVTVNGHPLGKLYATLLISRKFVGQSDTIMTSVAKPEFPIAAVVVALWQQFPDVGQFFLAYLYKDCPFFVPYFLPQIQGQNNEDYMKSLGYRITNGVLENHDLYLKRMCGIARLYAAIWITSRRRGETAPHPHNLQNGWRWLCEILNLDPLPEICATLICEALQVAGNAFLTTYGNQFIKLLMTIQTQYIPKLNRVDEGGPKARLESLVTKILQERKIDPPEGQLPPNYW